MIWCDGVNNTKTIIQCNNTLLILYKQVKFRCEVQCGFGVKYVPAEWCLGVKCDVVCGV